LNASKKRGCSQNVALSGITNAAKTSEVQGRLEGELQRLSAKLGLNLDLRVVWTPDPPNSLSGEVKGNTIYIYEVEEEKAIQALRHEVVDHLVTSRIVKPLVDLINLLIKAREAEIYKEKEKIVETLSKII
jgi:hypothetical protein